MEGLIENYLKQKYGEDYQKKAEDDYIERSDRANTGAFMSSIGDALAGRAPGSQNEHFNQLKKQAKDDTIGKVEKDRNEYVKNITENSSINDLISKEEILKAQKDATTRQSVIARALAKKYNLPVKDTDSYSDVAQFMDPAKMMQTEAASNVDFNKQKALKQMEFSNQSLRDKEKLGQEMQMAQYKAELEKVKKSDPKTLSGTDKARFDNAVMTLKALDDMGLALDKGNNTFSAIGDNDYTRAARNATEAYGRMQSGGAINKDEEARFEKALPGSMDDKGMQRTKILKQREEMISRLKTLGFEPKDIGYQPKDFEYGKTKSSGKPTTVIQNGHTYTLNPQTGEYE